MSEYQYFEFQAIDRRLDDTEMQELRRFSSRAQITPTSFSNEYSFGDFKGDSDLWMEEYFDAHLHLANWGTHKLQLRVSPNLLSFETGRKYCPGGSASIREKGGHLIFKFCSEEEGGGEWVEGNGVLSSILPLRAELIRGDLRALYIGWLLCAQEHEIDDDAVEPPVPPNLGSLTRSLANFAAFLRIDPDLLDAAAEASPRQELDPMNVAAMRTWVASLPSQEKDDLLIRAIEGKEPHLGTELFARFRRQAKAASVVGQKPRTVRELLAAAGARAKQRQIQAQRRSRRSVSDWR